MTTTTTKYSFRSMVSAVAHAVAGGRAGAKGLDKEVAAAEAGAGAVRKVAGEYAAGQTPKAIIGILGSAVKLENTDDFFAAAEALEENDLQFRSLSSTRKDAIVALPLVVDPFDTSRQAKKVAELCRTVASSHGFKELVRDLADGISKGFGVAEIVWDTSGPEWVPAAYHRRPMEWFVIDKADGRTLRLKTKGDPLDLEPNRFIVHTPNLKSGMPIRSGLAFVALLAAAIKALVVTDWVGFCELYGQPMRLGRFAAGTPEKDVRVLKAALANMGSSAYAVLPHNVAVEFINAGGVAGNAAVFREIIDYIDQSLAKLVLGQTLTSGSGDGHGSQALGRVHNEVRVDILKSDAASLSETLRKYVFGPLVAFNFGPDVPLPEIRLEVAEAEDLAALKDIVVALSPLVPIPRAWVYDKFSIPEPQEGEDVLVVATPVGPAVVPPGGAADPAEVSANSRGGCPVHSAHTPLKRDAFDDLAEAMSADWEEIEQSLGDALRVALESAGSFEEMQANVAAFVRDGDVSSLADKLTHARALAQLVGRAAGDIGDGANA